MISNEKKNLPKTEVNGEARSQVKDITNEIKSQVERDILYMLMARPFTTQDIKDVLGVKGSTLRIYINDLRCKGYPICASSHSEGYWMGTNEDVQNTIAEYHSRIEKMLEAVEGLNKALSQCPFQYNECAYLCEKCGKCEEK